MKRTIYIAAIAATLTSCVDDLNTLPLNKTEPVSEYVYGTSNQAYLEGLTKLYFQFVSNDLTDMQPMDGGASELIRAFWSVQETTQEVRVAAMAAIYIVRFIIQFLFIDPSTSLRMTVGRPSQDDNCHFERP